jgi:hypothetical protein
MKKPRLGEVFSVKFALLANFISHSAHSRIFHITVKGIFHILPQGKIFHFKTLLTNPFLYVRILKIIYRGHIWLFTDVKGVKA